MKRGRLIVRSPFVWIPKRKPPSHKVFGPQSERCRTMWCSVPDCFKGDRCDPHHTKTGASGGLDKDAAPLCRTHHTECHTIGFRTFDAKYGIDMRLIAYRLSGQ